MPKSASWKRRPVYFWLLGGLLLVLSGCNLLTSPNNSQTVISGLPVVQIAAPPPNATFLENVAVNIQVLVSNAGPDIERVEFIVDDTTVQTLKSPNTGGAASFSLAQAWTATGIGQHTLGVTAFRADGSSSAPASVTVSVVAQGAQIEPTATNTSGSNGQNTQGQNSNGNGQGQPTTVPPTNAPPPPTNPPQPTLSPTPNKPTATFLQGVNVRSGPSVKFNPPIGSFATGQTTDIVARTPAGDWYKVKYYNGEGWVFGQLLSVSGDEAQILVDAGPPIPTDTPVPTATPIPTPIPVAQVNLVAGLIRLDPAQPKCGQTFNIFIDVANQGSQANASGGSISVQDTRAADGSNASTTVGAFGVIQPGQTVNSGPIPLTVSTNYEDDHRLTLVVDSGNQVAETNENDNTNTFTYRLPKANCP